MTATRKLLSPVIARRRTGLLSLLIVFPLLLVDPVSASLPQAGGAPPRAPGDPEQVGQWTEPFDLGVIGIHATLLRTGEVLLFDFPADLGTRAKLWDPVTGGVTDVSLTRRRDLFCSGHTVLADGRVFVSGGTIYGAVRSVGTRESDVFDPADGTWEKTDALSYGRWYPTTIELPNGKVLIFSGQNDEERTVRRVERYDPTTGNVTTLPKSASRYMDLYPRMILLPDGTIFWAGEEQATRRFDPASESWTFVGDMHGYRYSGATVLLPGLARVLAMGGQGAGKATAEIIDFSDPTPKWTSTASMNRPRQHLNAVLLPDGTVLAVGGGRKGLYKDPEREAEVYDPAAGTWTLMAAQTAGRMYHSTAVLLPDGRVLSAGQNHGQYAETGEIFSPPYLFRGPRPTIGSAPSVVGCGEAFTISTPDAADIARVALIRPGSTTHGVNFDQRYVEMSFTPGSGELAVTAPATAAEAPPGWYMLFIVDSNGVPAIAAWVHVL